MSNECLMYHCITISFCEDKEAMVYIEDAGADNDGQIGAGIDVMVPTNGPILSLGKTVLTWDLLTPRLAKNTVGFLMFFGYEIRNPFFVLGSNMVLKSRR